LAASRPSNRRQPAQKRPFHGQFWPIRIENAGISIWHAQSRPVPWSVAAALSVLATGIPTAASSTGVPGTAVVAASRYAISTTHD
jgi:hypothetical protein